MSIRSFLNRNIRSIEEAPVSLHLWLASFFGIIIVRIFLENFSSNRLWNHPIDGLSALLHYPLAYAVFFITLILIVHKTSSVSIIQVTKVGLTALCIIWIAPIVDLLSNYFFGTQYIQAYIVAAPANIIPAFLGYFGPLLQQGITPGIRLEVVLLCIGVFWYIMDKKKSFTRAVFGAFLVYAALFIYAALPSILIAGKNLFSPLTQYDVASLNSVFQRWIAQTPLLSSQNNDQNFSSVSFIQGWNYLLSWIYLVILVPLIILWFRSYDRQKFQAVLANMRTERVLYYAALVITGVVIVYPGSGFGLLLSICVLVLALIASITIAIQINDLNDIVIDRVSNSSRPFANGTLNSNDGKTIIIVLSLYVFFAALSLRWELGFLLALWNVLYFLYSSAPLRLKRIIVISNMIIGLLAAVTVLMGYVVASGVSMITFPMKTLVFIFFIFTVLSPVKDIKDIEGDRANGIMTFANMFEWKRSRWLIASLIFFAGILVSLLFNVPRVTLFSLGAAASAGLYVAYAKKVRDSLLFYLFLLYLIVLLFLT